MDSNGILWLKEYGCTDGPLHPVQVEAKKYGKATKFEHYWHNHALRQNT